MTWQNNDGSCKDYKLRLKGSENKRYFKKSEITLTN